MKAGSAVTPIGDRRCMAAHHARAVERYADLVGAAVVRTSSARHRRGALGLLVLSVVVTASCGGVKGDAARTCSNPPSTVVEERPVEVPYDGPVRGHAELTTGASPGLVVQVTNSQPSVERVQLAFDGADALDVDLPAGAGCDPGDPVFSIAYDLPPGPVRVHLEVQGATSTSTIDVPASGTVWAVVDLQSERAWSDITLFDTRPSWG